MQTCTRHARSYARLVAATTDMADLTQNCILRINDEKTIQLIELYQHEECLWNTTLDEYKSKDKRASAAVRIAKKLNIKNFEAKHVMIKFKNLRNSYCQELKKIAHSLTLGLGDEQIYKPKVFWFSKMDSFLRPHLQPSRCKNFLLQYEESPNSKDSAIVNKNVKKEVETSEDSVDTEEWAQMSNAEDFVLPIIYNPPLGDDETPLLRKRSLGAHDIPNDKRLKTEMKLDEDASTSHQVMKNITTQLELLNRQKDDPYDCFGKYIASLLRSMPVKKALDLQPKIVSLVTSVAIMSNEGRVSQSDENNYS